MTETHHHSQGNGGKRRSKTEEETRSSFKHAEKYITQYFFRFLGFILLAAGAVFLVRQSNAGHSFLSGILSFFTSAAPEETARNTVFPFNGWKVLIQLLPGLLILLLPFFLSRRHPVLARTSAVAGTLWVFAVHGKVLSYDFLHTLTCYPTLWVAMTVTLALCIVPLWHAFKLRSGSLQLLVVILFYISLLFLTNNYQWHYYPDFLFLLFFTGIILLLGLKTGRLLPFYLQAFLSILLLALFFIRRLVMRDSADLVFTYIVISSIFYAVIFIAGLGINLKQRRVIYELVASLLMLVNTLFYWGSVLYVLRKYGFQDFQGLFTLLLALFNGTLLYFSPKINPGLFRNPYVFLTILLFSMVFPLWAGQNYVILFASVCSVLLLLYARYAKNRTGLVISIALVAIMSMMFIWKWILMYFPGLYSGAFPAGRALFYNGFQSGVFALFALFSSYQMVRKLETTAGKWFSRRKYRFVLNLLFIVFLYVSCLWCWHFLFSTFFPVAEVLALSWFSFTCLFLLLLIPVLEYQKSELLRPVFVMAAFTLVTWPLLVNFSIIEIRDLALIKDGIWLACFIAHFFLLTAGLGLMAYLYNALRKIWVSNRVMMHVLQAFTTGWCLSVILMEYDHITVFSGYTGGMKIAEMVSYNHHLPWSVILIVFSVLLIGFSMVGQHRFLPRLAVVLLLATLAKVLTFDLTVLGSTGRVTVLFILGAFLVAFSFFYRRFRTMVSDRRENRKS